MARTARDVPAFGQVASDYVPSDTDGEVWMRTFKNPLTQIRICPAEDVNERGETVFGANAWPTEREHYVDGLGSFPCPARFGIDCPGCADPSEKVREKRRQYYINALDDKGELRVYKFGVKLFETLKARQERAVARKPENQQPLSDRDYLINRMGKDLGTTYDPEPGDEYEVEWPEELHDIKELLKARYLAAMEYYDDDTDAGDDDGEPEPSRPAAKKTAAKKTAAAKPAAKSAEKDPDDEPAGDGDYGPLGATPNEDDLEDATTEELKKFLTGRGAEFPARAARSRLLEDAKKVAAEPPY